MQISTKGKSERGLQKSLLFLKHINEQEAQMCQVASTLSSLVEIKFLF